MADSSGTRMDATDAMALVNSSSSSIERHGGAEAANASSREGEGGSRARTIHNTKPAVVNAMEQTNAYLRHDACGLLTVARSTGYDITGLTCSSRFTAPGVRFKQKRGRAIASAPAIHRNSHNPYTLMRKLIRFVG